MRIFRRRRKERNTKERAEIDKAKKIAEDLERRKEKLLKDNHFVADVKKVLGAG